MDPLQSSQLFFTSPIGLGHATRDLAIVEKLKPILSNGKEVHFISGEGAAKYFSRKNLPVSDLYRCPKFDIEQGTLRHSFLWLWRYLSYYNKCKSISRNILKQNSGPLICDEDFATIDVGGEVDRPRVLITDMNEIEFTHGFAYLLLEKRMNSLMRKLMKDSNYVIFADDGDDRDNVIHVGPIVRETDSDRASLRKRFGFTRNTIVLTIGGTDAGKYLIEKTIEAFRKVQDKVDADLVIVPGPSLTLPDSTEYRNLGFIDNLHELIYAADLVISLAGRSTMDESITYGTPGIFIPIKNHFEQEAGAKRLGYSFEDIFGLEELIAEHIGQRRNRTNTKGAEKAAKIISTMIN